jgi:hypothetical protein
MSAALLIALAASIPVRAEVPLMSKAELGAESTHIVVGKIEMIYSATTESDDWVDSKSVAEIAVQRVEKGARIRTGDKVYGRFWNRRWVGQGDPDPYSRGHIVPEADGSVRVYLTRKDGAYHVLLPNGFEKVEQAAPAVAPNQAAATELDKLQGTWVRTIRTDDGIFKIIKEHIGNETTVTWFDPTGKVMAAKKSQFRLAQTDKVRIFTFFNNVVTAGPQTGETEEAPTSYIYRVTGDTFVEVNGLLVDDDAEPNAFTWQRVNE